MELNLELASPGFNRTRNFGRFVASGVSPDVEGVRLAARSRLTNFQTPEFFRPHPPDTPGPPGGTSGSTAGQRPAATDSARKA